MVNHTLRSMNVLELVPGVSVEQVVRPDSSAGVSDFIRDAGAASQTVIPFGGRRSLATANETETARWGIDLGGLVGIVAYEPADLTLSVRAGTTVAAIQRVLGEAGQELPIDIPFPHQTTIGGLVATGFAGPRRLRSGSLRDLLIGCEFVRGDGLLAKAGGMVVKNVSGFEIPRFLHGSWGGLAVITSVNLKVTPMPRADGTLRAMFDDLGSAIDMARKLVAADPSIEACVVTSDPEGVTLSARAVGRAGAVTAMIDSFAIHATTSADRLASAASRDHWQSLVDRYAENDSSIVLALGTRPRDVEALAIEAEAILGPAGGSMQVSPALGSVRIALPGNSGQSVEAGRAIGRLAVERGAVYVLESAPAALRATLATWGEPPEGIELMRSVKRQFDPADVLNRGRLFL